MRHGDRRPQQRSRCRLCRGLLTIAATCLAKFLGLPDYGRIGAGAVASLLLLEKNPLEDIRYSRTIAAVLLDGKRLPRSAD